MEPRGVAFPWAHSQSLTTKLTLSKRQGEALRVASTFYIEYINLNCFFDACEPSPSSSILFIEIYLSPGEIWGEIFH